MGYGHQRTAYPLRDLAPGRTVLNADAYQGIPARDRELWQQSRRFYEFVSTLEGVPLIGRSLFGIFDQFQKVANFYPRRDLHHPTLALRNIYRLLVKGWGRDFVRRLGENPLPLVTTFFVPAYMAEYFDYPGPIYCVICDAAISRTWAAPQAAKSRIHYFAPTSQVKERLIEYGVRPEKITVTGFPLPLENIGTIKEDILRRDLAARLQVLDPRKTFHAAFAGLIRDHLGRIATKTDRPPTVMFSIGGAGAQKHILVKALGSLAPRIKKGDIRFTIAAGTQPATHDFVTEVLADLDIGNGVTIVRAPDAARYFSAFNAALRTTDILWTKPSELSFYAALGVPLLLAPPLGSHEEKNRDWLLGLNAAIPQEDPRYANEWLIDYLSEGRFADVALAGFIKIARDGTRAIETTLRTHVARD